MGGASVELLGASIFAPDDGGIAAMRLPQRIPADDTPASGAQRPSVDVFAVRIEHEAAEVVCALMAGLDVGTDGGGSGTGRDLDHDATDQVLARPAGVEEAAHVVGKGRHSGL